MTAAVRQLARALMAAADELDGAGRLTHFDHSSPYH
jgi:hypothetical protein